MQNNGRRKETQGSKRSAKIKRVIFRFLGLPGEFCFALATYAVN